MKTILTTLAPLMLAAAALGTPQEGPARPALKKYNLEKKSLALEGYDPVAYFPVGGGKPAKGSKNRTASHAGVTYRFASDANRALFLADPERYEPSFGGWCAYAMADDDRVEVDPESFLIENGELLVFYDGFWGNTRKKWLEEGGAELKPKADKHWKKHSGENGRKLASWNLDGGLAVQGYDPVAYTKGGPAQGAAAHERTVRGVRYRFQSAASAKAFEADPTVFEPHFGGWCAYAMGEGKKVAIDPKSFLVRDGATYLFANHDARAKFEADPKGRIASATQAWAKLSR